jgi:hypothetical protein
MKKILTFFAALSCVFTLSVQETQAQSTSSTNPTPQFFANDITVEANTMANQRDVRVAAAYNGWVFAAYLVNDTVSHKGGVVVRYSKDGGVSWLPFNGYPYYAHSWYTACDLTVLGKDTSHLFVFVGLSRKDLVSQKTEVEVLRYNAYHVAFPPVQVYFNQLKMNTVFDLALANSFRQPARKDSVYGVGLLYSYQGTTADTLIFSTTIHKSGKIVFGNSRVINAAKHLGKVALSYSSSTASSRGTYHAAWESKDTTISKFGHILASRTLFNIDSTWITPVYLDTLFNPAFNNMVRNPSIASQCTATGANNDSTNAGTAVSFEYERNGHPDTLDIYGYYNMRGDTTGFWNQFKIIANNHKNMQANMTFDATGANNPFGITYFDSTAGALVYETQSMMFPTPNTWTMVDAHYNVSNSTLKNPWPRVVINPTPVFSAALPFFGWVSDAASKDGVVLCNAQYITGINEVDLGGIKIYTPYPNPASTMAVLPVSSEKPVDLTLTMFNLLGENVVAEQKEHLSGGMQQMQINVSELRAGLYFCRIQSGATSQTFRIVVQH